MKNTAVIYIALFAFAIAVTAGVFAEDATYVGNGQCKICHNKKDEGEAWTKWKNSPHAKAIETLNTDAAKAAAQKLNLAKAPAEAPECLKCHVTGYDAATGKAPEKIQTADGVQCEACHGPASAHTAEGKKFKSGDKDAKPGEKIGHPDEATCKKCHNEQSPTWKADRYTLPDGTKTGFDYKQAYAKIEHNNPLKKK
ncbi:MAG TPA: multiheme c-type cytochrome [Candidatus Hydrogenedentes bacterium]|nr:multiheme c-type cytochrome [Candidatus Hydrogenedentota bacterium]